MDLTVLRSGSAGNLTCVSAHADAAPTHLLIDVGPRPRAFVDDLAAHGLAPTDLAGVLVTHAHGDHAHVGTLRLLAAHGVSIHTTAGTWAVLRARLRREAEGRGDAAAALDAVDRCVRTFEPGAPFRLGGVEVLACRVSHGGRDGAPAGDPVCFRLSDGRDAIGYATDLGTVDAGVHAHLAGVGLLVIEANHDPAMLAATSRPPTVKAWIRGDAGHLRNEQAAEAAAALMRGRDGAAVVLAHLSERANTPELALARARAALRGAADVQIAVAAGAGLGVRWRLEGGRATPLPRAALPPMPHRTPAAPTGVRVGRPWPALAPRPYLCSRCHQPGHNRQTCPERRRGAPGAAVSLASAPIAVAPAAASPAPSPRRAYTCSRCGLTGHNAATCGRASTRSTPEAAAPAAASPDDIAARRDDLRARTERRHPGLPARLGVERDAALARAYGISRARVQQLRVDLGVPAVTAASTVPDAALPLLGTVPDAALAQRFGLPASRITAERTRRGIAPHAVQRDGAIAAHAELVGQISDRKLAARLGVSHGAVFRYRQRHGIVTRVLSPRHADFRRIDRDAVRRLFLDGHTDAQIAEAVGACPGTIATLRSQLRLVRRR